MIHLRVMKTIFATALLFSLALPAWAVSPVHIETDWLFDTYFSSFTSATSKIEDISGLAGAASYTSGNIVGFNYAIYGDGAGGVFTISQTTKTYSARTGFAPAISTGSATAFLDKIPLNGKFPTLTINPVFSFSVLDKNATYYLWVEYGKVKKP